MGLLSGTNIVVDKFTHGKDKPSFNYIYFLSHMHSDHYMGLHNGWDWGPIYCSTLTAKLLLRRFPKLKGVTPLELNKPYRLYLTQCKSLHCTVTLLDANHIFGSVMFLFQGYFGTYLHTGDMRFHEYMWTEYRALFPEGGGTTAEGLPRSIPVDELILDNTYCDPVFTFPRRDLCVKMVTDLIDANSPCDVYLSSYTAGKEELFVECAKKYSTRVWVSADRFEDLHALGFSHYFTLDESEAFIFVNRLAHDDDEANQAIFIRRRKRYVCIRPTGWCNTQTPLQQRDNEWVVPYSSHSNFAELEKFVASIRPAVLRGVVEGEKDCLSGKVGEIKYYHQYSFVLRNIRQRGPAMFTSKYVDYSRASHDYKQLRLESTRAQLNDLLGLKLSEGEIREDDTRMYDASTGLRADCEEENLINPVFPEKKPLPAKKPKGKDQRVDRLLLKQRREASQSRQRLYGRKHVDEDRLLRCLHGKTGTELRVQTANQHIWTNGDANRAMMEANMEREKARADRVGGGKGE